MYLYNIKKLHFLNKKYYILKYKKGRFYSNFDSSKHLTIFNILKWKLSKIKEISFKKEISPLSLKYDIKSLNNKKDKIVWLTHASFFIKISEFNILIDPVFYDIVGYKRYIKTPYKIDDFEKIDLVLVSHSHYDHADIKTLNEIYEKFNPLFIFPKFLNILPKKAKIVDLLWFESVDFQKLKIDFLPSKHWSRRGLFDKNRSLWGSFLIKNSKHSIYFAGDSGYDRHFYDIGLNYKIDFAILPIGAYKPQFIMKPSHLDPNEGVAAYKDLNAKFMIPMHYGTFKLSDEPLDEPLEMIKKHNDKNIKILKPGEIFLME